MEDNYIDNGELTFRKIGQKLKAAWLRAVVYIVIAVLISGIILGIISTVKSDKIFTSKVLFSNDNISKEMTPWDTTLNISKDIKSVALVSKALTDIGIEEDEKTEIINNVISNLSVNAEFPTENKDKDKEKKEEINNFVFRISLSNFKEIGLSKDKTQELLDAICSNYVKDYKAQFEYKEQNLAFDLAPNAFNYIYATEILDAELSKATTYAESMAKVDPNFVEKNSKESFELFAIEFKSLKSQLTAVQSYLANTGVMKSEASLTNEVKYIKQQLIALDANRVALEGQVKLLKEKCTELANSMQPSLSPDPSKGTIVVNINSKEYMELVDKMMNTQKQLDQVNKDIVFVNQLKDGYAPGGDQSQSEFAKASAEDKEAMQKEIDKLIGAIVTTGESLEKSFNDAIVQYNEYKNLSEAVKVSQLTKVSTSRSISTVMFIGIEVVVVIIAFIIAMVVTNKKGKINLNKKKILDSANSKNEEEPLEEENNKEEK